jgi:PhzF family phenazine biosynthesis protein
MLARAQVLQRLFSMTMYPFKQVDVFAAQALSGNPVAVVLDASGLSAADMQKLARWTNLSETTFVLPGTPGVSDYYLRIFTPQDELPFAGHPTIGTAHALLEAGLVQATQGRLLQSCRAGLIQLHVNEQDGQRWIGFDLPTPTITRLSSDQLRQVSASLALDVGQAVDARIIDVGPKWVVVRLNSDNEVRQLQPDLAHMASCDRAWGTVGVTVFGLSPNGTTPAMEVRSFAPSQGIPEDPVCGSGNGCVAALIREQALASLYPDGYIAQQGSAIGRNGRIRLSYNGPSIQVAGQAITVIQGHMTLSSTTCPPHD